MVPIWPEVEVKATLEEGEEAAEEREEFEILPDPYIDTLYNRITRLEKVVKQILLELQEFGADIEF